jgi:hypothetical protein
VSRTQDVPTPHGTARLHHHEVAGPRAVLVLGHSAGGGVQDPALLAAVSGAAAQHVSTVLVEQPYRVQGRRMPAPAAQVDAALLAVLEHLAGTGLPLVSGGRSFGGRVACRTSLAAPSAEAPGAPADGPVLGVLCLAFPLHPPGRPDRSRLPELDAVRVPALVVQGDRDPFGCPPPAAGRELVLLPADHSLRQALPAVRGAVARWLGGLLG